MSKGFADLHNHQFANLGFGGAAFHGHSFLPGWPGQDPALQLAVALPHCSSVHGPGGTGDIIGQLIRGAVPLFSGHLVGGNPQFDGWPRWDSVTHQAVYEDWLKRAVDGGLRLLVVLAVNNEKLGKIVAQKPSPSMIFPQLTGQIAAAKASQKKCLLIEFA